jgi:predicted ferric reductase
VFHALRGPGGTLSLARQASALTGLALLVILLVMAWASAGLRRRRRELFTAVHFLYAPWLTLMLVHSPRFWAWMTFPALLFLADALVRWGWKTRKVTILEMKPLANGVTWVRFRKPKGFRFQPGDHLHLNLPAVSLSQWHPFTISAAPESSELAVHVRVNGDWTGALHNLSRKKTSAGRTWPARIDGPYGSPSSRILSCRTAVMVAAGIGVTPFASVLQSLLLRRREGSTPEGQTIHFHWLNRSHRSYEWFVDLLKEAEKTLGEDRFRLHIHLTSLTHDLTNIAMQLAMDAYRDRHERDPLTGLAAETSAGRPDWDAVFAALARERPGEKADVFFCGPPALGAAVRRNARRHGFPCHEEKF